VTSPRGGLPLLAPMSEVAGRMAVQAGAFLLEKPHGGKGLLLGGVPGVAPGKVVIVGGGVVGTHAAMIAVGMGADVVVMLTSARSLGRRDAVGARVNRHGACRRGGCRDGAGAHLVVGRC
jgi:alanine dehydrogenase